MFLEHFVTGNIKDVSESECDEYVKNEFGNKVSFEIKEFKSKNIKYKSFKGIGLSFEFSKGVLVNIHLFRKNSSFGYLSDFTGSLPYGITLGLTNREVVSKFGEPNRKGGGEKFPIWIEYSSLGVMFEFEKGDWNIVNNSIASVVLFQKEVK